MSSRGGWCARTGLRAVDGAYVAAVLALAAGVAHRSGLALTTAAAAAAASPPSRVPLLSAAGARALFAAAGALASRGEWPAGAPTGVAAASAAGAALAALLLLAAAGLLHLSLRPSSWVSRKHEAHYDAAARGGTLVRPARKSGADAPCPYPDAWYAVALSEELPPGAVRDVTVCNQNLVVFRPALARGARAWPAPAVLDAYCPHMGAHLALGGGRVAGDCVVCPFHGWCFDAAGKLASTPSGDCPPGSDLRAWPVSERNGVVAVWMSATLHTHPAYARQAVRVAPSAAATAAAAAAAAAAASAATAAAATAAAAARGGSSEGDAPGAPSGEGAPGAAPGGGAAPGAAARAAAPGAGGRVSLDADALAAAAPGAAAAPANEPWFEIPVISGPHSPALGVTPPPLAYHGCTENLVASIIWENPENGADVAHLPVLHAEFILPALYPLLSHKWSASWRVRESAPHLADITVKEAVVLGRVVDLPGEVDVTITQCGPSQVFIDLATPVGRVLVVETVTPVAPRLQRVMHAAYAAPAVPRAFAKAILYSVMVQYEKDVPVWCNKVYAPRPHLAKHDPAVGAYRRWARRFVPPGAVTFRDAVRAHAADAMGLPAETGLEW